jgi:hypothetical protein
LATVQFITEKPATKIMLRCPTCDAVDLKSRKTKTPRLRCSNGHEFDQPREQTVAVTAFTAHYEGSYVDAPDAVPIASLKAAAPRRSDQLSIEEIDLSRLEKALVQSYPTTRDLLEQYIQSTAIDDSESEPDVGAGNQEPDGFSPNMSDTRQSILREIKARRGQRKFRVALLKRYGQRCVITGCELADVLEAAHIWPYRGERDNHAENGLLLRADLHTLFDLDLVAIEPQSLQVHLAPALQKVAAYAPLHEQRLVLLSKEPSRDALNRRWETFKGKWLK